MSSDGDAIDLEHRDPNGLNSHLGVRGVLQYKLSEKRKKSEKNSWQHINKKRPKSGRIIVKTYLHIISLSFSECVTFLIKLFLILAINSVNLQKLQTFAYNDIFCKMLQDFNAPCFFTKFQNSCFTDTPFQRHFRRA